MSDRKNHHRARVNVFAYRKAPELPVQLSVSPDFLDLHELEKHEITIEWKLVTKGYRFPTDGSAIVFTSPVSKETFRRSEVVDEENSPDRLVRISIAANTGLAYAYTVSVIDDATGLTAVLDPAVQVPPQ